MNKNESDERPDPKHEIARISVVVYDGARCSIERPDAMMATEAIALLTAAAGVRLLGPELVWTAGGPEDRRRLASETSGTYLKRHYS